MELIHTYSNHKMVLVEAHTKGAPSGSISKISTHLHIHHIYHVRGIRHPSMVGLIPRTCTFFTPLGSSLPSAFNLILSALWCGPCWLVSDYGLYLSVPSRSLTPGVNRIASYSLGSLYVTGEIRHAVPFSNMIGAHQYWYWWLWNMYGR